MLRMEKSVNSHENNVVADVLAIITLTKVGQDVEWFWTGRRRNARSIWNGASGYRDYSRDDFSGGGNSGGLAVLRNEPNHRRRFGGRDASLRSKYGI
jgi:hypothetical protein